jgi:YVTN family beta-propeller protein
MKTRLGKICIVCLILAAIGLGGSMALGAAKSGYLSPLAVVAGDSELYLAYHTAGEVGVFDTKANKVVKRYKTGGNPMDLAMDRAGNKLYVAGGETAGKVYVIDLKANRVSGKIEVGNTPSSVTVSPDGKTLYVCNKFDNDVSVVDTSSKKEVTRIAVVRMPVASVITGDGEQLFVANLLSAGASDGDFVAAAVSVIDTRSKTEQSRITLPNGSMNVRGICVSPDGAYVYVTHILARYQLPTTQLERGWMNTNAVSIIDVKDRRLLSTVLLDDVDLGAANPWSVACSADGEYLCISCAGAQEVSIIDREDLHAKLEKLLKQQGEAGDAAGGYGTASDLSVLVGLRRRVKVNGNGPRGLAVLGNKVYAAEYFTDSISIVDIEDSDKTTVESVSLGSKTKLTDVRRGEMYFHDASLCFQQWQSCSSCHPDVRSDGLNWDLLNDGFGNPKNTKSLLLSHKTPPVMVSGVRDKAETAVRSGFKFILFSGDFEPQAEAIDAYLKSLKPKASPYLVDGKLSESAMRGKAVFETADCSSCHSGELFTGLEKFDVGTGIGREKGFEFDTPTLVELWRSGPYLYDGRAATIKEVLTVYNTDDKHGKTSNLTKQQIDDLAEFILSQ